MESPWKPASFAFLFSLFLCLGSSGLKAQEEAVAAEHAEAAKGLFDQMDMKTLLEESLAQSLEAQAGQFAQMGLPPEGITELQEEMLSFMLEHMSWDSLEADFVRIYTDTFSEEELKEITKFYETPIGKKTARLTPQLMAEGMKLGQKRVESKQTELQQRITPIIQKYLAP